MIIQHNIMAINSHRQLGVNNSNLSKNLEKLSSGYRINRAADDAAGLAISEKMRAQITCINRAVQNAQDGSSLIQTAEGALTEVHSMLNRMVDVAMESHNGTFDDAVDRANLDKEFQALKAEIDRIGTSTNFNGITLLNGFLATGLTLQIGETTKTFDALKVSIIDLRASGANLNLGTNKIDTFGDAGAAIDAVKLAINKVSTTRGELGAWQNRLDHTISNLGATGENMTAAESRIRDVDMAKEMMAFTKNSVLAQAAQSMLAQANQQPQNVLQLLR